MNNPDAAAGPWCCYNENAGEATDAAVVGESRSFFADVVADYSTNDFFELVCEQEGQAGSPPAVSCLCPPRFSSKPPPNDVRFDPPSEDEMAAWLGTIVKGEELACNDDGDDGGGGGGAGRPMADDGRLPDVAAPPAMGTSTETDRKGKQVPTTTTEGMMMGSKEMRKAPAGESSRRSHHGEAHNLTEKRRRHKINEMLKTLQELVPGCSKSNQASTLDKTIHYMKSLQHQVQAMSVGLAVYPVAQPHGVAPGTPVAGSFPATPTMVHGGHPLSTTMVPFGTTMLQLPHYPGAAVMMPAAAVAPMYLATAPTSTAVAPGDAVSANRLHGSRGSRSSEGRGKQCSSTMWKHQEGSHSK